VVARDQIDRRGLKLPAALATQALNEVLKGHIALALDQQAHRIAYRAAAALQLDDAVRPIGELVRRTELWRVHLPIQIRERTENKSEKGSRRAAADRWRGFAR
jgi:hypothetical protein